MRINEVRRIGAVNASLMAMMVVLAGGVAPARAADDVAPAIWSVGGTHPHGDGLWQASLGMRTSLLRDPGYDPFSTNDISTQVSVSVSRAFGVGLGFQPALGLVWDAGESQAFARSVEASLTLQRLAVALEGRFIPAPGVYVMARLAPGVLRAAASLADASAPAPLEIRYVTASLDAGAGAGVRLTPAASPVGFWLVADGGYGWTSAHDLTLRPSLPSTDVDKAGVTPLGSLAVRGPFLRFSLALSY